MVPGYPHPPQSGLESTPGLQECTGGKHPSLPSQRHSKCPACSWCGEGQEGGGRDIGVGGGVVGKGLSQELKVCVLIKGLSLTGTDLSISESPFLHL